MTEQIFYCKAQGVRVPVRLEVFKYGGGIYLAISNRAENINIPFFGPAPAMVARLREAADLIEAAVEARDQGHISRAGNGHTPAPRVAPAAPPAPPKPVLADFTGEPRHDWPLFVRKFHGGAAADVLPAIAHYYKKTFQYSAPEIDAILEAEERLELDFELCRPALADILESDGRLKRGARARVADALGVKDAGNYRGRIDTVLGFVLDNSEELLGSLAPNQAKPNESNAIIEPEVYQKRRTRAA